VHFYEAGLTVRRVAMRMTGFRTGRNDSRGAFVNSGFPHDLLPQIGLDRFTSPDYADQRYYASSYGRFNTPDRMSRSMRLKQPESLNRYLYALDDPINRYDPTGNCDWGTFATSAMTAVGGGIAITLGAGVEIETAGIATAVGAAGVILSGTTAAFAGAAGMIGSCTGMTKEQIDLLTNATNPGGTVSIAFMAILTNGTANVSQSAQIGAYTFDALSGYYSLKDVATSVMNQTANATDLLNFASTALTALADFLGYDPAHKLSWIYTPPMDLSSSATEVPYDASNYYDSLSVDQGGFRDDAQAADDPGEGQ